MKIKGSGSGRGSDVMKIRGSGSGRGSDVIIAAHEGSDNYRCQNVRGFQELLFEPNHQSVDLLKVIVNRKVTDAIV